MSLIAPTSQNAAEVIDRYYGKPALFMEEILGMELDTWQKEVCELFHKQDRIAIASGHSSGKSALSAGLIQYFIAVHSDPQIIVTANTQQQLKEKTWRELAKWYNKSLLKDWFEWTATKFSLKAAPETWFASAVPNTPHSAEAFAGAHEKYMLMIFDEASAIEQAIWEVAEGATATEGGYRKWIVFGNPTRVDGAFFNCFHSMRHRWYNIKLDTRTCRYADQKQIKEWAEDYGEDSDFFRVRVKGDFPRQSVTQLIGLTTVEQACKRVLRETDYSHAPKILGVDVARFGDDASVIAYRQGLKLHWLKEYREINTMDLAAYIAEIYSEINPDAVFIDEGSMGAGVIDRLMQLNYRRIYPVQFGSTKGIDTGVANKRADIWVKMRNWLAAGGSIPKDSGLIDDLTGPKYGFNNQEKIILEKKSDMKKRGLASPDKGDALACTFAFPVQKAIKSNQDTWMEKLKKRMRYMSVVTSNRGSHMVA